MFWRVILEDFNNKIVKMLMNNISRKPIDNLEAEIQKKKFLPLVGNEDCVFCFIGEEKCL